MTEFFADDWEEAARQNEQSAEVEKVGQTVELASEELMNRWSHETKTSRYHAAVQSLEFGEECDYCPRNSKGAIGPLGLAKTLTAAGVVVKMLYKVRWSLLRWRR